MKNRKEFLKKLATEIVFLKYDFEQAVIKSMPEGDYFVKLKGQKEFKAKDESKLVTDAILEGNEITEKEYERFI